MKKGIILTATLALFVSGCAALEPWVRDFNILPLAEERDLGTQLSAEIAREMTLSKNASANLKVRSIGERSAAALPRRDFDYRFLVVEDNSPNAFTIPGGIVYVHTGLLAFVDDEGELAGVIAHEVAHAYERHPAKNISLTYGLDYLTGLLAKNDRSNLRKLALELAKGGVLLRYSRQDEDEADALGVDLLKRAGYPSDGLLRFLKKLEQSEKSGFLPTIFRTHPPTRERISRLESLISNN
jgi:predicted Zn-dependent protease